MAKKSKNISGVSDSISEHIKKDLASPDRVKKLLDGKKIGISISESEDIELNGFSDEHLKDAMVEFARYLLVQGATLLYGGDLRKDGYTLLFSELSFQYRDRSEHRKNHFVNYSSYPIYLGISKTQELEFKKNRVEFIKVSPPETIQSVSESWFPPDTYKNKEEWAISLSKMRDEMNKTSDARIFLGGKSKGYSGSMPGLLEEIMLSIESKHPTYLIGAFGGMTGAIINSITGKNAEQVTEKFQFENASYKDFINCLRKEKKASVNYPEMVKKLKSFGLKGLSDCNGLTKEENKILFTTPHIPVMIHYVLKGLSIVYNKKSKQK